MPRRKRVHSDALLLTPTHDELCEVGQKWLGRKGYQVAFKELRSIMMHQHPDAIGWNCRGQSCLIEVKVSRADYKRDGKKIHVICPLVGARRYYLVPKGLIAKEELREGWGLLEYDGKRVYRTVDAPLHAERSVDYECAMLVYALRNRAGDAVAAPT